jgi:phenylpropionate dioxygenase-like ring-hydroxylating dioxygenase large terminal subunit
MLRNYWYIACASSRLGREPHASRVLDEDLVLFRDASGSPAALRNRCCHRGVPLSLGNVLNGTLECGYHGWRYDRTGQCVHIPSLLTEDAVPDGASVESYPCREQEGYVWVWVGDPDLATTQPLQITGFGDRRWWQGSVPMQCAALMGIENNLDSCHPYFVHRWRHGRYFATRFRGFREQCFEVRGTKHGLVVFAPATSDDRQQIPASPTVSLSFSLPDRVTVEFSRPFRYVVVMHFVSTGRTTCRLEWLATRMMPFGPRLRWTAWEPTIFAQDRRLLEGAQPHYERAGASFERSVAADTATLMVRRIVALAAEGRWNQGGESRPVRRLVRLRV